MIAQGIERAMSFEGKTAAELKNAMRYAVIPGGKRWRPLLLIAIYEMLTGFKKKQGLSDAVTAAVALELMHNAALVHDDLPSVNNRLERRSLPAVHKKWDNSIAILAGDALFTLAFEVISQISNPEKALAASQILATYTKSYGMIGGQMVDIEMKRKQMKINTLRFIDGKKVGALLQAASDIACMLADADESDRQVMNTYSNNLGIAHQMIADIASYYNRSGDDIDFSEDFVPTQRRSYTGLLGFDLARSTAERLLKECERIIRPYPNREALEEFILMIQDLLP